MVRFAAENPRFIKICFSWKSEFYENPCFMKIRFLRKSVFLKIQFWQSCFLKYRVFRKSKFSRKFRKSLIFWKLGYQKTQKFENEKLSELTLISQVGPDFKDAWTWDVLNEMHVNTYWKWYCIIYEYVGHGEIKGFFIQEEQILALKKSFI